MDLPVHLPSCGQNTIGITDVCSPSKIYLGSWDLSSGLHRCVAGS